MIRKVIFMYLFRKYFLFPLVQFFSPVFLEPIAFRLFCFHFVAVALVALTSNLHVAQYPGHPSVLLLLTSLAALTHVITPSVLSCFLEHHLS